MHMHMKRTCRVESIGKQIGQKLTDLTSATCHQTDSYHTLWLSRLSRLHKHKHLIPENLKLLFFKVISRV